MASRLNPYISFKGNAHEALEFYHSVFGGNLDTSTYKDGGMPFDPGEESKIMHGRLIATNGMVLMCADTPNNMKHPEESNISLSLSGEGEDEAELTKYFTKLSEGGTVTEPLAKAPWGDTFGMFTDKFGVAWMVNIAGPKPA